MSWLNHGEWKRDLILSEKEVKLMRFLRSVAHVFILLVTASLFVPVCVLGGEKQSYSVESITVTAEKREENIQDVPISMSVFNDIQIEDAGITDMTELTYFTPNLYSKQNTNQNMVIMRGLSSHNVILNTPVGLFVDDINYPLTFIQNPDLIDAERVEILRGPQGTLYGRNTEAGAIKIITKQPDNDFRAKIFSEQGVYDTPDDHPFLFRAGVSLSGPVIENKLYMGLAFQTKESDGYFENELNGNDEAAKTGHKTGQGTIRWTPSDQMDISLLVNGLKNKDGYGVTRYSNGPWQSDRYKIKWDGENEWEDENCGQALKIKYKGGAFNLVSITTRNDFKTDFKNDGEFGPAVFPDQVFKFENTAVSQEMRISSPENSEKFEWLFGLYGFKDDNDTKAEFFGKTRYTDFENKGYAVFAQGTYTVFDRIHLTAGLRYDYQESEGEQRFNEKPEPYSGDFDHSEFLPKGTVSIDFTDNAMGYVSVAKGLLAGGFNYAFAQGSDSLTFDAESTWNYEVGMKTSWFDNRLVVNAAVFHIDIKDKQVEEYVSGPAMRSVTNAAEAYSRGFEMDFMAQPLKGFSLFGGLGIVDAKIDQWVSDEATGGQFDFKDKDLTFAPAYTYNAGIKYSFDTGYYARADILGVGNFYTNSKNTQEINGYETVNLSIGYQGQSFDIVLWCKNVFDEEYLTNKNTYIGGSTIVEDGAPRSIGTTIAYRF
jgi:iron complex outermembrane receptor protein